MERVTSKEYRLIGQKLIRERPDLAYIRENGIRIAYLTCDQEKKKNKKIILADCTRVTDEWTWCCKYDFFITVYLPNVVELTDEQKEILVLHELHHVGLDNDGEEPKFYIVPHDVEEFDDIIRDYGLHWNIGGEGDE